jgi:hypothetical protein
MLDFSGAVIAVNERTIRLTFPHDCAIPGNDMLLLGRNFKNPGFALLPSVLPHLCLEGYFTRGVPCPLVSMWYPAE